MRFAFIGLLLCSLFNLASAAEQPYVLVLSSQRNAETIAEAARMFKDRYPDLRIQARTDAQLRENPQQARELLANSSGILGMGLYGPSVAQLLPQLKQQSKPQLLFSSDHRLVKQSFWRQALFTDDQQMREISASNPSEDFNTWLAQQLQRYPALTPWITARSYWQAGGSENISQLFAWFFQQLGKNTTPQKAQPEPRLRWMSSGGIAAELPVFKSGTVTLLVDHPGGGRPADRALLRQLCRQLEQAPDSHCLVALAYWGEAGVRAVADIRDYLAKHPSLRLNGVVMLQDFVIGGGDGRHAVSELFGELNVPVIKAIKLRDRSAVERRLSADGLAQEKVYYQVAMPELQGASQPLVIATAGAQTTDPVSGIRIQPITAVAEGLHAVAERIRRWQLLQSKPNAEKKIAIVYYNHPPGRHNIGADNLDVPASLWQILTELKAAGYATGELPASPEALLDSLQERGVNLPNDAGALQTMAPLVQRMDGESYRRWFATLPYSVRQEMEQGPFGLLHAQIVEAIAAGKPELGVTALEHTFEEMHHLLEGVQHPGRERALALVEQLEHCYETALQPGGSSECLKQSEQTIAALQQTGIEGLGGWGAAPGKVMTFEGQLLLPGIRFGNIFVGPQPPRGWEINEELLHANLAFPPPHQYLAFYHYLREQFAADALVHVGRHSTYEFLPRRSVGLAEDDYPRIIAGNIPGIYPYIVDGVGEGIQAKRRGLAVMVDHLTPPLQSTPLYDQLLQLRQLVESFETMHGSENEAVTQRLVQQIRDKINELELKDELAEAMSSELAIMGIRFEDVDDDMLVHEIGHYLTDLQERFMPLGLHIFGRDWQQNATDMMLNSMSPANSEQRADWLARLSASPDAEMRALLDGLSGGFIEPGQGNDPIRSPESLPTGRNFYALDSSLIPSRVAWDLGREMAADARANNSQDASKREALILWASDVVRDEGVMVAFGLDMLGLEPQWNSRGLVTGLKRQKLDKGRVRRDMVFTTSGLFRDLYGQQMLLLNRATLLALDASSDTIIRDYPALTVALQSALKPLGKEARGGSESLKQNQVAAHWVKQTRDLLTAQVSAAAAGVIASQRVFGDAPGSYGAGINRLAERSGAWEKRSELAQVYMRRLGHSYGLSGFGTPAQDSFKTVLADVENTYFGRSSNLYGLIDNNDAFDYLGGLSLSVETLTGAAPNNFVLDHSNPQRVVARPLGTALRQELRGRFLNPQWLKPLMEHGYAGARTMGSEFIEYLWGWQITNPTLVGDWAWEEVKAVYIDDRHNLQLDEFLEQGYNVHVKSNMLAVMLVAIQKEFWRADEATIKQLAGEFADLVAANGLPGSGHTDPSHPMFPWLQDYVTEQQWQQLQQQLALAQQPEQAKTEVHRLKELALQDKQQTASSDAAQSSTDATDAEQQVQNWQWLGAALVLLAIVSAGFYRSLRRTRRI